MFYGTRQAEAKSNEMLRGSPGSVECHRAPHIRDFDTAGIIELHIWGWFDRLLDQKTEGRAYILSSYEHPNASTY